VDLLLHRDLRDIPRPFALCATTQQALGDMVDMNEAKKQTDRVLDLMFSAKDLAIDSLAPGESVAW
jgi:hypothetical protein